MQQLAPQGHWEQWAWPLEEQVPWYLAAPLHLFVEQFKELTGWGETDPKDSSWLFMDRLDHETGQREPMGRLCVSLSLLPLSMAEVNPVGSGRSEPNTNPYLPPPTGARARARRKRVPL